MPEGLVVYLEEAKVDEILSLLRTPLRVQTIEKSEANARDEAVVRSIAIRPKHSVRLARAFM
jgi:hypothetical protein